MEALGYAAHSATDELVPFHFQRRDLRADDVLIDVLFCGVCHTDLHIGRNHGGHTNYPVVPGHEIVGRVREVGSAVTTFKIGQHVGVGCMVDSCRHCRACTAGEEESCEHGATYTYNAVDRHDHSKTLGGYSNIITVSEKFVLRIPEGLDLAGAAPLLCAGITTWSPLHRWNVGKGSKVAVIGLGGLGHMALKIAKALGADVTLFTRSDSKNEDALRLGADRVVISTALDQMAGVANHFDLIIDTVPYAHDLNPYLPTLSTHGTLVLVGFMGPLDPPVNAGALVFGQKAIAGSFIGGVAETQEMLDFCGEHGIVSDIEIIAMRDINNAWERMLKSDVKYRFVIDMATLAN
jgi:uncharacterized zinc-type alcohol dehydrogenase-like protein